MYKFIIKNTIISIILIISTNISAFEKPEDLSFSLRYYEYLKENGGDNFTLKISGIEDGLLTANAYLIANGKTPMYCQPDHLTLHYNQIMQMLEKETKITQRSIDSPISLIVLDSLRRSFPCQKINN